MTSDPGGLPPGLDVLWGLREPGRRGPRPGLSVDSIVRAATDVAASEGLDAVSMARVAKELGFTTMSLYRYVDSKDELLALMWNASALGSETLELEGDSWRPRLLSWAMRQREILDRNTWITQMPIGTPPLAPNSLAWVERGLEVLEDTGLTDTEKLGVIGLISSYTLSEARMSAEAAREREQAAADGRPAPEFTRLLRQLVDADSYPVLHRIAWSDDPDEGEAVAFRFGLERILDGVESLVSRPATSG